MYSEVVSEKSELISPRDNLIVPTPFLVVVKQRISKPSEEKVSFPHNLLNPSKYNQIHIHSLANSYLVRSCNIYFLLVYLLFANEA